MSIEISDIIMNYVGDTVFSNNINIELLDKQGLYRFNNNPNLFTILLNEPGGFSLIDWEWVSKNTHKIQKKFNVDAIQLLRENFDLINWKALSLNESPEAIQLLRENFDLINWKALSLNKSPEYIQLLR